MMSNILTEALKDVRTVVIAGHTRPDGDCVGSCLGLAHYLRENYPEVSVDVRLEQVPESYRIIPGSETIISSYDDEKIYDLFIALDASDRERLAAAEKYFATAGKTICIDHHISNRGYAGNNLVKGNASSTCEVLCELMDMDKVSYNAAFALYVGIICDSGVFKYSSTSRRTMELAGQLMDKGIPYTEMIDSVFYEKTYTQNLMMAECLLASFRDFDGKFVGTVATREMFDRIGAGHDDLEGVVSQLRLTKGCEVALLVSVNEDGSSKFSLRSANYVDVAAIAGKFGGGGHVRAAGYTVYGPYEEALSLTMKMVKEQLDSCTME